MYNSGTFGNPFPVRANYFEVMKKPDWSLLQYRVDFVPEIDHMGVRKAMVRDHAATLGKYIFDGTLLYGTTRLTDVSFFF